MKTKIGLPLGLALVMFIGVFTTMLALGALNPQPAEAVGGGFEVTIPDKLPGAQSDWSFTVETALAFESGDTLTITFPDGFDVLGTGVTTAGNWTLGLDSDDVPQAPVSDPVLSRQAVTLTAHSDMFDLTAPVAPAVNSIPVSFTAPEDPAEGAEGIVNPSTEMANVAISVITSVETTADATNGDPVGTSAGTSMSFNIAHTPLVLDGVTADPVSPGVVAQYVIEFTTGSNGALLSKSGTITVHFDKDFGGLDPLTKDDIIISSTAGTQNPAVDPTRNRISSPATYVGNYIYTFTVPDMNGDTDGSPGVEANERVTVTISPGAGISNPTEAGDKGPIGVYTSAEPALQSQTIFVPRELFLLDYDNNRNKDITIVGRGFKDGTTATIWLDIDQDKVRDDDEFTLIQALVQSDDTFETKITVRVPPFDPGHGNYINAVDGRNWTPTTDLPSFEVQGLMTVNPKTVGPGDEVQVSLVDWASGNPAVLATGTTLATITIGGVSHSKNITFENGTADFSLEIANGVPIGMQRMDLSAANEADDTVLTITGAGVEVSPTTVTANQTLSVSGTGFSGGGASINGTTTYETDPSQNKTPSSVTFGGSATDLKSINQGASIKINGGQRIDVDDGGGWSASILVPITDASVTQGDQQLKIIDSLGREGVAFVKIAERTLSLSPSESRPGTTVDVVGTGYPANNSKNGADSVVLVSISYDGSVVSTVTPDASGSFATSFRVPLTANIPSTNNVEATFNAPNLTSPVRDFSVHTVPGATITLSAEEGSAGDTLTVSGQGFKAFSSVASLTIGDLEIDVSANTGPDGTFETSFLVPELDTGIQNVEVKIGKTTASASFRIGEPVEETMMPVMMNEAMAPAMAFAPVVAEENLVKVFHFDPATQNEAPNYGWTIYDARPLFMATNTLDTIEPGGFYFLQVDQDQMDVEIGGTTMNLYAGLNPVQW